MKTIFHSLNYVCLTVLLAACAGTTTPAPSGTSTPAAAPVATQLPAESATSTSAPEPASVAPPPAQVLKPGNYKHTLETPDGVRNYLLHVPPAYDGSAALPLVLVLHGYSGDAAGMAHSTGMDAVANRVGFFVAYLNGKGDPPGWNSGINPEMGLTVDDVAFVRQLIGALSKGLWVDTSRVYATGLSNGAAMSNRLAADLPDLLAGVAIVAGSIGIRQPDGSVARIPEARGPIPVLMIHGLKDPNVLYDGGLGGGQLQLDALPVSDQVNFWTEADGCTGSPLKATSADGNVITEDYQGCAAGSEVELITIVNGGHEWPTAQGHTHFSASDAIWDFFSRHPG